MGTYIVRRLLHSVLVLFGVSIIVFVLLYVSGDPAALMLPPEATQQDIEQFRHQQGLDRPLYEQYVSFASQAVRGDFGQSLWYRQPAGGLVMERMPATFELALAGLAVALVVAVPLGVLAATHRGSWVDTLSGLVVLLGQSLPIYWLGLLMVLMFTVNLHLLPSSGRGTWANLVQPALTLGIYSMARLARITRSGMLEVLGQDYVRTARAKGLAERVVIYGHALRNALIPLTTYLGLEIGSLLGGAVITETIFAWPGVGQLAVQAIFNRDYPLVQADVFMVATIFVLVNLLVDLLYPLMDPRIRLGGGAA